MRRREDDRLLRGRGQFVNDCGHGGDLVAEFVRSPVACGHITSLGLDEARRAPGVVAVYDAGALAFIGPSSVNPLLDGLEALPMNGLARERVDAVGQPVAVVVARDRRMARDAAEMVVVETDGAGAAGTRRLAGDWRGGSRRDETVAALFARAAHVVEVAIDHARVAPCPMEPRSARAAFDGRTLSVWLSTQTPFRCRDDLARMLDLERNDVRVIPVDVGGAFGGKASIMPEDVVVAACALKLGTAVHWHGSRGEDFQSATQGRGASMRARMAIDDNGHILALEADLDFDLGHWTPYSAGAAPRNAGRILPGPYTAGHYATRLHTHSSDRPAMNIYRGAGRPEAALLMEQLLERAARATGLDPLTIRLRNLPPAGSPPLDRGNGVILDRGDYQGLLRRLAQVSNLDRLHAELGERRAAGEIVGLGLALYVEPCGQGYETASVTLTDDGKIRVATGSSAQGQGRETATAQIAADELGIPAEAIEVSTAHTADLEDGIGALASRSTAIGGSAVLRAARMFRATLFNFAAEALGCRPHDLELVDDGFSDSQQFISLAELARRRRENDGTPLVVQLRFETAAEAWASGAVLAVVAIDAETGRPFIEQIVWIDDAGRIINPMLVEGQLWGGLAQGIGATLMEEMVYDERGQLLSGSFMDYAVPRATDMPRSVGIEGRPVPSSANPLGVKGVGEAGCIGVPAALLNAVHDALDLHSSPVTVNLPLTPERIWRALRSQGSNP
ncbi:MAG: xanthine dehydrogenase family protein molybdopterin-binding subunit [Geminicoccaceae bacterium]